MARIQVYPKIVITLDTIDSREDIDAAFDDFYDDAKAKIRTIVAGLSRTSIPRGGDVWHYHPSTGPRDEVEP